MNAGHTQLVLYVKSFYTRRGNSIFEKSFDFFFFPLFLVCRLRTRVLDREKNDYGLVFVVFCFF